MICDGTALAKYHSSADLRFDDPNDGLRFRLNIEHLVARADQILCVFSPYSAAGYFQFVEQKEWVFIQGLICKVLLT
jgi:hypothetical protein